MTTTPTTAAPASAVTYGYIYSHMRNHVRVTTLITLAPGDDFVTGAPCVDVADAEARVAAMGVVLVKPFTLHEMVYARRDEQKPAPLIDPLANEDEALAYVELPSDHDLTIEVGDRVSVFPPGAWEPRVATVEAVREGGMYLVHFAFGVTKWMFERDITLLLKREAAALTTEAISA